MIPEYLTPLANHLWQSTLFAAAVWVLTLALRKNRAAVRHRLWLAASVKFLIPFSLLVSLGAQIPWRPASVSAPPQISIVMETISRPFAESSLPFAPAPAVAPVAPLDTKPLPEPQPSWIPAIVVFIWISGFGASMVWWFIRWRQLWRSVQRATVLNLDVPDLSVRVMSCPERLEPGVFGIFRPVLLLPEGITSRLSPAQLRCVIDHELCHVGRRDNMVATIHMFVESLFWFHPLVWWIKVRLIDEQERACDEAVLGLARDPQVYAESILKICEFYLTSPLTCVSGITGSNLKKRIENIMKNRIGLRLSFSRIALLAVAAITVLAGPVAIGVFKTPEVFAESGRIISALTEPIAPVSLFPERAPAGETSQAQVLPSAVLTTPPAVVQGGQVAGIQGSWDITAHTPSGKIQIMLSMPDAPRMSGTTFEEVSTFRIRNLTPAQIASPVKTAAHFEIVRESGTFECEGTFEAGFGTGTFVLRLDPAFLLQMASFGFSNIQDKQLVSMVLYEAGPRYLGELRSAGLGVLTFDQLIGMRVLGVTGEFIRSIQQAGFTPNANVLTGMWVNGVTADFAREIQQMYPSVSIDELIGMKVQGVTANFAREARQTDPSISINDLIGMRIQGIAPGRLSRQTNSSQSMTAPTADGRPTWAIEPAFGSNGMPFPDRIQLVFSYPGGGTSSNSFMFEPSVFRGLTSAQMGSPIRTPVRFDIVREAGTIAFEGYFQSGRGSGTLLFQPNPGFRGQMLGLGFQDITDNQLFNMAVYDVGPRYAADLRAAGVNVASAPQLMSMRIQGITLEYIREIQQLGYTVNGSELINARVQGINPDYIREMRQIFPSVSMRDLVNMKVQAIFPDYVQEMRQIYPSASIRDVINMKVQAIFPDFVRDVRQLYPSASINDVVSMKIQGVRTGR